VLPGVAASARSDESIPLACPGCAVTAATTRNTPERQTAMPKNPIASTQSATSPLGLLPR
jgi:hypothetical protein